jgi:hypothetical protein
MNENRRGQDEGDLGHTELDPQEQAEADVNLDDPSAGADEPWSPPDRMPRGSEFVGVETGEGETLDQRINQEQPDPGTAYGAPDDRAERESERMVGGDDPDAIPADQDVLGGPAGSVAGDSPEESAMHVEEDEPGV